MRPARHLSTLLVELVEHLGGVADPAAPASASQLVLLLRRELSRALGQVPGPRAGYDRPIVLTVGALPAHLAAFVPVDGRLRSDATALDGQPRGLLLVASALEALVIATSQGPALPGGLVATYGTFEGALVVAMPWPRSLAPDESDAELAALQWDDRLAGTDRLRVVAAPLPGAVSAQLAGGLVLERSIGHHHPLDALEVLVRAGVEPADAVAVVECGGDPVLAAAATADEEPTVDLIALDAIVVGALGPRAAGNRPHEDADPARRIARRMLQMLRGKRKWSGGTGAGYHTEITHLTRGFDRRERELAAAVVDALLGAGLLVEKLSVGQRHISLFSRRAADIDALIDEGRVPPDLRLPSGRP
jgi:hypothetical protein